MLKIEVKACIFRSGHSKITQKNFSNSSSVEGRAFESEKKPLTLQKFVLCKVGYRILQNFQSNVQILTILSITRPQNHAITPTFFRCSCGKVGFLRFPLVSFGFMMFRVGSIHIPPVPVQVTVSQLCFFFLVRVKPKPLRITVKSRGTCSFICRVINV